MKLPQLLHSTRSYGRANSAFSWKLLVLERGFLSYRLKLPCDRSKKDAWFGYSPVGALRKLPFGRFRDRAAAENPLCSTTAAKNRRSLRSCKRSSSRQDGIVPQRADYLISWHHLRVKSFPRWNSLLFDPQLQSAVDVPHFPTQMPV